MVPPDASQTIALDYDLVKNCSVNKQALNSK